jgi:dolichol kinase
MDVPIRMTPNGVAFAPQVHVLFHVLALAQSCFGPAEQIGIGQSLVLFTTAYAERNAVFTAAICSAVWADSLAANAGENDGRSGRLITHMLCHGRDGYVRREVFHTSQGLVGSTIWLNTRQVS